MHQQDNYLNKLGDVCIQKIHSSLILRVIIDLYGNQTSYIAHALLDADFSLLDRIQHPAKLQERRYITPLLAKWAYCYLILRV